jgi:hypothetical protein
MMKARYRLVSCMAALGVAWLALVAATAEASQVRPLNLDELTERAAKVLAGRCVDVRPFTAPGLDLPAVEIRLEVGRWAKGHGGETAVVRMASRGHVPAPCEPGQEVVLFLYGESRVGLTSPVGLGQGAFRVTTDKTGRRIAVGGASPSTLTRGLSPETAAILGASGGPPRSSPAVPEAVLLEAVERRVAREAR